MKITAILGSPRKKGNGAILTRKICDVAISNGHTARIFYLYDENIRGCMACESCRDKRVDFCIHHDDFQVIANEMIESGCIIITSPIYLGHISGPLKTFFDRWSTFIEKDFSIRNVKGKLFVTVTTSAAPAEQFGNVTEYLKHWLAEFFKMEHFGSIIAGGLIHSGDVENRPELLLEAETIGKKL